VLALLELLIGEDNTLNLDFDDEIIAGACIVRDGEVVNPGAKATVDGSAGAAPARTTAAAAPSSPAEATGSAADEPLGGGAQQ